MLLKAFNKPMRNEFAHEFFDLHSRACGTAAADRRFDREICVGDLPYASREPRSTDLARGTQETLDGESSDTRRFFDLSSVDSAAH